MTNFEKYQDELMKIEGSFAFDKNTEKIAGCDTTDGVKSCIDCKDCLFDKGNCFESDKIKWLYEEYKEPILSDDELELINSLSKINGKKYEYIHKNGKRVFLFSEKPPMDKWGIRFTDKCNYLTIEEHSNAKNLFLNIKFEDGLYDIENKCFIKE
jgi:hypothetical protein